MNKIKLKAVLFVLFAFQTVSLASADDSTVMIDKLGREAINTLTDPKSKLPEVENKFLALLTRDFAVKDIAQFVLGRYWKTADDSQKERFVAIFQHRLTKAYASRFKEFAGVNFAVKGNREDAGYSIVNTTIQKVGGPETQVDWWVKGGKIHDVVIGGISMRSTLRDDYNAHVAKHGGQMDVFLKDLESRA
jgi:phospholipid transport system substrate-binding protein